MSPVAVTTSPVSSTPTALTATCELDHGGVCALQHQGWALSLRLNMPTATAHTKWQGGRPITEANAFRRMGGG